VGFVTPLFLAGVLAVALPFWLHRLQTRSSERKPFSSTMLLETAEQRIHVKRKLKYLLLLALRVVLLILLALAFAGPFLTRPPNEIVASDSGTHLVLVDTSASMGRTGVFDQALDAARAAIAAAPNDALVQVLNADGVLSRHGELSSDKGVARSALGSLGVSSLRLDFGEAMSGVERIAAGVPAPVTLHFVSDFQAGGLPVRFTDLVPRGVTELVPRPVGSGEPFNWSAEFVRTGAGRVQFGLSGSGDRERIANVEFVLNGSIVETRSITGTGPQVIEFELPELEAGENRLELRIDADDDLAADNRWFHVLDNRPPAAVPLLTADPGGLPATYLAAALESAGRYELETLLPGTFDPRVFGRYNWVLVDDLGVVDAETAAALVDYLQNGGNLLAFAGERADGLEALPVSGHRFEPAAIAAAGDFRTIGQIDDAHPALARAEGWRNVHVTRSLPLQSIAGDEVLIRLDDNQPLLLERRVGAGHMLLAALHLDNRWSDLPVRPVFVSFMVDVAAYLAGSAEITRAFTAGDNLPLAVAGGTSGQVVDPDGNRILSLADTTRDQQIKLNKPGFYEVYTQQGQSVVAVNLDTRESGLTRLEPEVIERWTSATAGQADAAASVTSVVEERTLELWHWALLLLAVIVIGESIVGNMHLSPRRVERA